MIPNRTTVVPLHVAWFQHFLITKCFTCLSYTVKRLTWNIFKFAFLIWWRFIFPSWIVFWSQWPRGRYIDTHGKDYTRLWDTSSSWVRGLCRCVLDWNLESCWAQYSFMTCLNPTVKTRSRCLYTFQHVHK